MHTYTLFLSFYIYSGFSFRHLLNRLPFETQPPLFILKFHHNLLTNFVWMKEFPAHLVQWVEYGAQSQEPPTKPSAPVVPPSLLQAAAAASASGSAAQPASQAPQVDDFWLIKITFQKLLNYFKLIFSSALLNIPVLNVSSGSLIFLLQQQPQRMHYIAATKFCIVCLCLEAFRI